MLQGTFQNLHKRFPLALRSTQVHVLFIFIQHATHARGSRSLEQHIRNLNINIACNLMQSIFSSPSARLARVFACP